MRSYLHKKTAGTRNKYMSRVFLVVAFIMLLEAMCLQAAELQEFKAVRYVPDASNDGDSFLVNVTEKGGEKEHVLPHRPAEVRKPGTP